MDFLIGEVINVQSGEDMLTLCAPIESGTADPTRRSTQGCPSQYVCSKQEWEEIEETDSNQGTSFFLQNSHKGMVQSKIFEF